MTNENEIKNEGHQEEKFRCGHKRQKSRFHGLFIISLVAAAVAIGVGYACNDHNFAKMTPERVQKLIDWKVNDILDDIDASDSQREQVHAIKLEAIKEFRNFHKDGMAEHKTMLEEIKSETPDRDRLIAKVDAHLEAKRELSYKMVDYGLELHKVLSPEQRVQLAQMMEDHMAKFDEHLNAE